MVGWRVLISVLLGAVLAQAHEAVPNRYKQHAHQHSHEDSSSHEPAKRKLMDDEEDLSKYDPAHPDFPENTRYSPERDVNYLLEEPDNHIDEIWTYKPELTLPSKSRYNGHTPDDIIRFRDTYRSLRLRYPDVPLFTMEDHLRVEQDMAKAFTRQMDAVGDSVDKDNEAGRDGRLFGLGSMSLGLGMGGLSGLFKSMGFGGGFGLGTDGIFNPVGSLMSGNQFSVSYTNKNLKGVGEAARDFVTGGNAVATRKQFKNIEPCSNGDGVCTDAQYCLQNGGFISGNCDSKACDGCGSCCQYVYEDCMATSCETISFFQSPGFPDTRRDAYSCSMSFEIRPDVDQVLIEFIVFELPISKKGCTDEDYLEIISPQKPNGVFGSGNSRLCGHNSGQHIYLSVNPKDLLILKVTTSGVQSVPLALDKKFKEFEFHGNYAYRFKIKVTQLFASGGYIDTKSSDLGKFIFKKETPGLGDIHVNKFGEIPNFYMRLRAASGCLQYFTDIRGQIESFNYDGKSRFAANQAYSICIDTPSDSCGLKLKALMFDIPTNVPECMNGTKAVYNLQNKDGKEEWYPCCTSGFSDKYVTKFLGIDSTSAGHIDKKRFVNDQFRYFFCGSSLGRSSFIETSRKGPLRLQVYSDGKLCPDYKERGVGFRIKYDVETGTC